MNTNDGVTESAGPVVLLTDFGHADPFVGQMKGVISGIAPGAEIIDLCNEVPVQNIFVAAMFLQESRKFFPPGTIFLVVVDPGVGSERRGIIVRAFNQYFVGPDNGIFDLVVGQDTSWQSVSIENPKYRLERVSSTFHGRDIFAPAAAYLADGADFSTFGPRVDSLVKISLKPPVLKGNTIDGMIVHFDHFGNGWTNISRGFLETTGWLKNPERIVVHAGSLSVRGLSETYSKADRDKPLALINSFDLLEIAWYRESAREKLGLKEGAMIELTLHH